MPSFLEMQQAAVASGVVNAKASHLADGPYPLTLANAEAKNAKTGIPQISLLWKTADGRATFQNLSFGSNKGADKNAQTIAISLNAIEDLGVSREFLASTSDLTALAAEITRVAKGVTFNVQVKTTDNGQYVNSNFRIKGRVQNLQAVQGVTILGQAVPAQVVPVQAPVPIQVVPVQQPAQVVFPVQTNQATIPAVQFPQNQSPPVQVPTVAGLDPTTGLPPRPGI